MFFIGQSQIMKQLQYILPHLYDGNNSMNILIRGPSGWGKTRMALGICNYLTGGDFKLYLGNDVKFDPSKRVHFIDEVHLLTTPEVMYPIMDSGKYVIIIATNDVSILPEALSNRCTELIFDRYTMPELREICRTCLAKRLSDDFMDYIIESGGYNPRVIKGLAYKINIVTTSQPTIFSGMSINDFKEVMKVIFGIRDGMDVMCYRYIDCLTSLGGTASMQTISAYLHIDQNTLKFFVEPVLLYKNRIKINSKGRSLV